MIRDPDDYAINRALAREDDAGRLEGQERDRQRIAREDARLRRAWLGGPGIATFVVVAFIIGFWLGGATERRWPAPDVMPSLAEETQK